MCFLFMVCFSIRLLCCFLTFKGNWFFIFPLFLCKNIHKNARKCGDHCADERRSLRFSCNFMQNYFGELCFSPAWLMAERANSTHARQYFIGACACVFAMFSPLFFIWYIFIPIIKILALYGF